MKPLLPLPNKRWFRQLLFWSMFLNLLLMTRPFPRKGYSFTRNAVYMFLKDAYDRKAGPRPIGFLRSPTAR